MRRSNFKLLTRHWPWRVTPGRSSVSCQQWEPCFGSVVANAFGVVIPPHPAPTAIEISGGRATVSSPRRGRRSALLRSRPAVDSPPYLNSVALLPALARSRASGDFEQSVGTWPPTREPERRSPIRRVVEFEPRRVGDRRSAAQFRGTNRGFLRAMESVLAGAGWDEGELPGNPSPTGKKLSGVVHRLPVRKWELHKYRCEINDSSPLSPSKKRTIILPVCRC